MSFFKVFFSLVALTLLSKVLGFLREVLLSYYYGASEITDAYLVALTIPGVLFSFFSMAIAVGFIPVFSGVPEKDRNDFTNTVFSFFIVISTLIVFITVIFAEFFVDVLAPGFTLESKQLSVKFTRIFVLGVYFSCWLSVFTAFLNYHKKFTVVALAGIPLNFSILLSIILSYYYGLSYLILGAVFGKLFEVIYLYPYVRRLGYKYSFRLDFFNKNVQVLIYLSLPLTLSIAVNQINIIVAKSLASGFGVGGVSAINYSHYLIELVVGLFVLTVTTIYYPDMSKSYSLNNYNKVEDISNKSFKLVNFFVVPAFVYFIFRSEQVISFIYERGSFDKHSLQLTAPVFLFFSLGLIFYAYREILVRIYYSAKNTKIPVINTVVGIISNILLSFLFSSFLGIKGLALATSVSAAITIILLFFSLKVVKIRLNMSHISIDFLKCLSASCAGILILDFFEFYYFITELILFLIIYFLFLFIFKNEFLIGFYRVIIKNN